MSVITNVHYKLLYCADITNSQNLAALVRSVDVIKYAITIASAQKMRE